MNIRKLAHQWFLCGEPWSRGVMKLLGLRGEHYKGRTILYVDGVWRITNGSRWGFVPMKFATRDDARLAVLRDEACRIDRMQYQHEQAKVGAA